MSAAGLQIECNAPKDGAVLTKWLTAWAKQAHGAGLEGAAAELLLEMVGPELGLLDQELAKLAVSVPQGQKSPAAMVTQMVGSWRAKTVWEMLDAALDGNVAQALTQLDRLLLAGRTSGRRSSGRSQPRSGGWPPPPGWSSTARRSIAGVSPREALQQAGVNPYYVGKVERQLRRLGRHRGEQLYRWLLDADLDLKGDSTLPARMVLERLFVRLVK